MFKEGHLISMQNQVEYLSYNCSYPLFFLCIYLILTSQGQTAPDLGDHEALISHQGVSPRQLLWSCKDFPPPPPPKPKNQFWVFPNSHSHMREEEEAGKKKCLCEQDIVVGYNPKWNLGPWTFILLFLQSLKKALGSSLNFLHIPQKYFFPK